MATARYTFSNIEAQEETGGATTAESGQAQPPTPPPSSTSSWPPETPEPSDRTGSRTLATLIFNVPLSQESPEVRARLADDLSAVAAEILKGECVWAGLIQFLDFEP